MIPNHVSIHGNDDVDALAKAALNMVPDKKNEINLKKIKTPQIDFKHENQTNSNKEMTTGSSNYSPS